jgi:hypothetical protein
LHDDGRLLVAIPAPDDLIELRGETEGGRCERTIATFAGEFQVAAQSRATTAANLSKEAVEDVLLAIYRPLRQQPVTAMRVTFSLDLLLFAPRR